MSLFVPGTKIKSVSLEGKVGAGGFETFTTSTTVAFKFTGVEGLDETERLDETNGPDESMAPAVPGGPEASTVTGRPVADTPDEPDTPVA